MPKTSNGADYDAFIKLTKGKKSVKVSDIYDLGGHIVALEKGSILQIENSGKILNGSIIGDESTIKKSNQGVGVILLGTWNQDLIDDKYFDWSVLDDNSIIKNIEALQSEVIHNTICLSKKNYLVQIEKESGYCIYPKSNCTFIINSEIAIKPNNFKSYNIILVRKKRNVKISGTGKIVGDVGKHTYVVGSSSEWGMGIKIDESSDVTIANLTITKCTGDGIYITGGNEEYIGKYEHASRSIVIDGVTCNDNRRQGISVIHVDGLTVSNCSLINTGRTEFTKPASGIDIEPNVSNGRNMSVKNIVVTDCKAMNNRQYDYVTSGCVYIDGVYNFNNVKFTRCSSSGICYFTSPVLLTNSEIGSMKLLSYDMPIDVVVEKTTINNGIDFHCPSKFISLRGGKKIINSLMISGCTLNYNNDICKCRLFRRLAGSMENVGTIRIEDTEINITGEEKGLIQIKDNQIPPILVINSVINMPGYDFLPQNNRYKNVTFRCSSVCGFEGTGRSIFEKCKVEHLDHNITLGMVDYIILFVFVALNLIILL
jgi:parallel beta-helix repeat protein